MIAIESTWWPGKEGDKTRILLSFPVRLVPVRFKVEKWSDWAGIGTISFSLQEPGSFYF